VKVSGGVEGVEGPVEYTATPGSTWSHLDTVKGVRRVQQIQYMYFPLFFWSRYAGFFHERTIVVKITLESDFICCIRY
jgi:hypothetical protein